MFFFVSSVGKQNESGQETKSELNVGHKTGKKEVVSLEIKEPDDLWQPHPKGVEEGEGGISPQNDDYRAQHPKFFSVNFHDCISYIWLEEQSGVTSQPI